MILMHILSCFPLCLFAALCTYAIKTPTWQIELSIHKWFYSHTGIVISCLKTEGNVLTEIAVWKLGLSLAQVFYRFQSSSRHYVEYASDEQMREATSWFALSASPYTVQIATLPLLYTGLLPKSCHLILISAQAYIVHSACFYLRSIWCFAYHISTAIQQVQSVFSHLHIGGWRRCDLQVWT